MAGGSGSYTGATGACEKGAVRCLCGAWYVLFLELSLPLFPFPGLTHASDGVIKCWLKEIPEVSEIKRNSFKLCFLFLQYVFFEGSSDANLTSWAIEWWADRLMVHPFMHVTSLEDASPWVKTCEEEAHSKTQG